ncbi:MAG: transcription termination factor Rho [Ilumatobacteraceae bacterium]|nr:transcription termination factor Rho [Ilumatobacteraceae bacterium]
MAAPQLGRAQLEEKDRDDLAQIATALGIKGVAKATRESLIGKILEETMVTEPKPSTTPKSSDKSSDKTANKAPAKATDKAAAKAADKAPLGADGEALAEWEVELAEHEGTPIAADARVRPERSGDTRSDRNDRGDRNFRDRNSGDRNSGDRNFGNRNDRNDRDSGDRNFGDRNRRRRGRRRPGGRDDGPQGDDRYEIDQVDSNEPVSTEPVKVEGYLDLRDEGYGFLRLNGYLPTRNDPYVSVRYTRQFGLRKGDHLTGLSRPAGRNEKNPALLEVYLVNGGEPEKARNRKKFEELTPLFPDEKLVLSSSDEPMNMTARIVDLISPIGKGQRGIIVSPPKAGKTTVMKTIATSIEKNHPEVKLIVLLIDERPEEVTDMRRTVKGEVVASTFDRPSEEHTAVAELVIEKAKRLVEIGEDVVVILDGITRLSRAYNLAQPTSGRIMSGGIDAGALYPPKKFFGAARNIEEGGSLTILATALVETNSRMDEAIFEEFKGTGNMELRLDRKLAERRVYPAIDVDASSTRHEELLFDRKQLQMVWKLRRVLSGLAADGNAAPGLELLIDRLKSFKTNDEFLSEIAKQPTA